MLSGEKVTLNGGLALNSYQEDTDIDRHKYVYACLGQLYFVGGNLSDDTCAIFLNKDLLKQPSCLVQDQKFQKQLGLGNSSLNFNSDRKDLYQDTNQSSLVAADYVNLMAIGMATGVVDYNSTFPEIMFKDEVASSKIDYVLQPYSDNYTSSTKNNQADYEAFEDEISNLENVKNDPKNKAKTDKWYL